ncbi:MAG: DUF2089 domain-containing protein [Fibrobacteres bacterium]|jgi:hypothetical protein|nr:DUF2089 domain-containing protein [Fibrobacterota bacterium]
MKLIDSNLACPACQQALQPKLLVCPACDIKVEGPFQLNEFATLGPEDLHFLRIFVRSEGRIRDMESALGLSYPTIRARLSALKRKLSGEAADTGGAEDEAKRPRNEEEAVAAVLAKLNAGKIPFAEAMQEIKRIRAQPGKE